MSKRKIDKLFEAIQQMASLLEQGDVSLSVDEVRQQLREGGIDPDALMAQFHQAAVRMAEARRLQDRPVPLTLDQAIDATRPGDQMPQNLKSAKAFAERWLERFTSAFVVPPDLETARAYRKSGDVNATDQDDLDRLEQELKEKVKRENE